MSVTRFRTQTFTILRMAKTSGSSEIPSTFDMLLYSCGMTLSLYMNTFVQLSVGLYLEMVFVQPLFASA
mgnify:FL=1